MKYAQCTHNATAAVNEELFVILGSSTTHCSMVIWGQAHGRYTPYTYSACVYAGATVAGFRCFVICVTVFPMAPVIVPPQWNIAAHIIPNPKFSHL